MANLQQRSKLGNERPSDEVEGLKFEVRWEPANGALGVGIPAEVFIVPEGLLHIVSFHFG